MQNYYRDGRNGPCERKRNVSVSGPYYKIPPNDVADLQSYAPGSNAVNQEPLVYIRGNPSPTTVK